MKKGVIPDIAVFYDGVNEIGVAMESGFAGEISNQASLSKSFNEAQYSQSWSKSTLKSVSDFFMKSPLIKKITTQKADQEFLPGGGAPADSLAEYVVKQYLTNMKIARTVGDLYNIKVYGFWQPNLSTKKHQTETEKKRAPDTRMVRYKNELMKYSRIFLEKELPGSDFLFDISNVFDDIEYSVYIDESHLTPQGNEIVADRIIDIIWNDNYQ